MRTDNKAQSSAGKLCKYLIIAASILPAGCSQVDHGKLSKIAPTFAETKATSLPGWHQDKVLKALPALRKSCLVMLRSLEVGAKSKRKIELLSGWKHVCNQIKAKRFSESSFRDFLKTDFNVFQIRYKGSGEGLFTGYYEPTLHGSFKSTEEYNTPVYPKPDDLIHVDLGKWKNTLNGSHVFGRVVGEKLKPYFSRSEISSGALAGKLKPILWLKSDVDAFFLHIQGSGRVILPSGEVYRLGYAGKNGRKYYSIGRYLVKIGAISKEAVSMQSIKKWLNANPGKKTDVLNMNPSYVFFRRIKSNSGPIGSQGVSLTSGRSLAVDRRYSALGAPIWLSADFQDEKGRKLQRLMIAQDTGGAIRGPIRGDVFWGSGKTAEQLAGVMKAKGSIYVFFPKGINPNQSGT
ncbi:MAG: MltA domain-containing protein [Nisaea sp.]|nr:MltA domain-containing protein [Nisaea sp.]